APPNASAGVPAAGGAGAAGVAGREPPGRPDPLRAAGLRRMRPTDPAPPRAAPAGGAAVMKIAIGSDHRGFEVKRRVASVLRHLGHEVIDVGPQSGESVDYPDYAFQVATAVSEKQIDRGILICGTGIGMCIAANKVVGV